MRRTPLKRKTPLKVKKRMEAGKGLPQAKPLSARTPIRPKRETPRRRVRANGNHAAMLWSDVRLVIYARSLGCCEVCGRNLNVVNMEAHHRRTRTIGPDCPCNALAVCRDCHHDRVHAGPEEARGKGWIVSRHSTTEPADVPVIVAGARVLLTCGGTVVPSPLVVGT